MRMRQKALYWGMPLLVIFFAVHVIPFAYTVWYSMLNNTFKKEFVGIDNYVKMFTNKYFRLAMYNTTRFALPGVAAAFCVSLLLAYGFKETNKGTGAGMAFIMPVLLPSAAAALVFGNAFSVSGMETILGQGTVRYISLLLIYVWKNTGMLFIILLSAMRMVPASIYEAAALDGAGKWRSLFSITLPNISGAIIFSCTYAVMQAFKVYKEAYLMYGAYPGDAIYMLQHYMNNHFAKLEFQYVAAAGTLFALICVVVAFAAGIAEEKVSR